jgi:hypothetical protein
MLIQARIALFAAMLLGVVYLPSFAGQTLTLVSSGATVSDVGFWLMRFLVFLALPVMLVVWFRSGAIITPSKKLRWCAIGTAIVLGAFFVLGGFFTATRLFGWSIVTTAPAPLRSPLWSILRYLSDGAFVLLAIALSRRSGDAAPERTSALGPLRKVALAATIAAIVALVLNTIQLANSANLQMAQRYGLLMMEGGHAEYLRRPTAAQIALGFAVDTLVPLCRLMIPLIVYRSLSAVLHR